MFLVIKKVKDRCGQATVEAAFAIPILMLLILMLIQPGIVLYDKIVMEGAASEGCRLLSTTTVENEPANEEYVRRRLSSIPEIDIFHVHSSGCSWEIELNGNDSSSTVSTSIKTEIKPLPLLDLGIRALGVANPNGNIELKVESSMQVQPDWAIASIGGTPQSDIR